MPNHVHTVVMPLDGVSVTDIVHSWKSFSALAVNRTMGRTGPLWQKDYFDRILRDEGDLERTINYVMNNATRAGLKNWKWQGRPWVP